MEVMKTFDCVRDMPDEIREAFYKDRHTQGHSNGAYIQWIVYPEGLLKEDLKGGEEIVSIDKNGSRKEENWCYFVKGIDLISDWLFEQGIKPGKTVLIKLWW